MERKTQPIYEFGPFVLDTTQHQLFREQEPVPLTPKTYDTLLVLVENNGRMLSKDELMKALWPDSFVEESNLTVQISTIRKALGSEHRYIVTVPGRGYRFSATVKERQGRGDVITQDPADWERRIEEVESESRPGWPTAGSLALHAVPQPEAKPARARRMTPWLAAGAMVLAAVLLFVLRPPMPAPRVVRYTPITTSGRVDPTSKIVTDGTRIYFVAHPAGRQTLNLNQASVDGRETAEIPLPSDGFSLCAISPDHSELMMLGSLETPVYHPVWIVSVLGGSPRRLGNISAFDASWTPDGQRIIYSVAKDVYIANTDGGSPRKLFTTPGYASDFRWSPSGRILRFSVSDRSSSLRSLWEAGAEGSHAHPVQSRWSAPSNYLSGEWTPDGKYYLFESVRDGQGGIVAVREKRDVFHKHSDDPTALTTGPLQFSNPVLSPDGKHLFVVSEQHRGDLVRYDAESSGFTPYLPGLSGHRLSFTADGQWVTYTTYPDSELWRSKADGSEKLRLTSAPVRADVPRWSPDGKQIVFMAGRGGKPGDIYLIAASGGQPERLLPPGSSGSHPDWSPDGTTVVYGPRPTFALGPMGGGETATPDTAIRMLDLSSRKISNLPDSAKLYWPRWSPDGKHIASISVDTRRLMLYDFGTQKWTELAQGKTVHNPLWSRDGKTIYFQDLGGRGQPIYRVQIGGHKAERFAGSEEIRRADSVYSAFTGLTPDGSPVVMLIHALYDIYGLELVLP
jgi:Tol biopolymer transport system component/DNA-binding winged helix-turn-helix (wHTH) protein